MPRIQALELDLAPAESRAALQGVQRKLGRVPNLIGTLAHSPAALNAYLGLGDALSAGAFSPGERELIALAVSQENGCEYCLAAHSAIGRSLGLEGHVMRAARAGESDDDPKLAALTSLARDLARFRGRVEPASIDAFLAAGWEERHVVELVAHVAANTLSNYLNHVAETEVDFPVAAPV